MIFVILHAILRFLSKLHTKRSPHQPVLPPPHLHLTRYIWEDKLIDDDEIINIVKNNNNLVSQRYSFSQTAGLEVIDILLIIIIIINNAEIVFFIWDILRTEIMNASIEKSE